MSVKMRQARHVALMGERMIAYRMLVGNPEGEKPLRTLKRIKGEVVPVLK
jgi:hypothetical protein